MYKHKTSIAKEISKKTSRFLIANVVILLIVLFVILLTVLYVINFYAHNRFAARSMTLVSYHCNSVKQKHKLEVYVVTWNTEQLLSSTTGIRVLSD